MNEEALESGKLKEGGEIKVVVVKSPDQDASKTEISSSIPMTPIVPPTVPPIPQTTLVPSPSSTPTLILPPQIPESGSPPSVSPSPSLNVDSSPPAPIPQSSSQSICTPPTPTPGPPSPPSIPQAPSPPSTSPPSMPTPTTMPVSIHQPPPTPTPLTPTLPRTPPLSSLHVTLLSEPPRAFMGRGTPPDRRRLSEWGRWGCVRTQIRAMGLCGDVQHSMVMRGDGQNVQLQLRHGEAQQQQQHTSTSEHTSVPHGEHTSAQHGEAQQQQHHEHGEHPLAQHAETHHDEHAHPPPHEPDHSEHLPTHGEWTSFLFAMLEGDPVGSSTGWYELGAGVPASSSVSGPGEPVSGSVVGMGSQGMNTLNVSALSVPQTVGEADSTLRFALG